VEYLEKLKTERRKIKRRSKFKEKIKRIRIEELKERLKNKTKS